MLLYIVFRVRLGRGRGGTRDFPFLVCIHVRPSTTGQNAAKAKAQDEDAPDEYRVCAATATVSASAPAAACCRRTWSRYTRSQSKRCRRRCGYPLPFRSHHIRLRIGGQGASCSSWLV